MKVEVFCVLLVIFLWLISAWDALLRLSRGRVRRLESRDKSLSRKVEEWLEDRDSYVLVLRILNFFLIAFMAGIAYRYCQDFKAFEKVSPLYGALLIAAGIFAMFFFAELIARFLLHRFDLVLLKFTVPVIKVFRYSFLYPVVFLLQRVESQVESWQTNDNQEDRTTTEDEILSLVEQDDDEPDSEQELEEDERRMIRGIFDLDDSLVREIMTPRVDLVALPADTTIEEAKKEIVRSGHSRIPVYDDSVDDIKGIIYAKDFLDDERCSENKNLSEFAHIPIFIPETKNVGDLLEEFQKNNVHFAVIIGEYGGTSGIVTMEDILEEIVGEIRDEYDINEKEEDEPRIMGDGSALLDARTLLGDVNELLDADIPEDDEDVDTIGGYICAKIGRIPRKGEELTIENRYQVTITEADERRIFTLTLKVLPEEN